MFLKRRYMMALVIIGAVLISAHVLMIQHLGHLKAAGNAINLAGRQRMLSQRLTKLALLMESERSAAAAVREMLQTDAAEWASVQVALREGDREKNIPRNTDEAIAGLLAASEEAHKTMLAAIGVIGREPLGGVAGSHEAMAGPLAQLLKAEPIYLEAMEKIVFAMAENADRATAGQERLSLSLLVMALAILGLEAAFIFRPAVATITRAAGHLRDANQRLEKALAKALSGMLAVCSFCKAVKEDDGTWRPIDDYLVNNTEVRLSRGLSPECFTENYGE